MQSFGEPWQDYLQFQFVAGNVLMESGYVR